MREGIRILENSRTTLLDCMNAFCTSGRFPCFPFAFPYHHGIRKEVPMAHFRNDYSYLAHPRIFKALERINDAEQVAYGLDAHSNKAADLIRKAFS